MDARAQLQPATLHRIYAATTVVAMLAVVLIVGRTSHAAFTASTDNSGNTFVADSIDLVDNSGVSVLFDLPAMGPSTVVESCITVTYSSGAATSEVRLYGATSGNLAPFLDLEVDYEDDATSAFGDCAGFSADGTAYDGTLQGFAALHTDFASGAGSWNVGDGDTRVYRFRVELRPEDAAQGESAEADFTWEARTDS